MATVVLVPSAKGFRTFASGGGVTPEDIIWNAAYMDVSFTTLTSQVDYGGSTASSTKKADNSGAGLRASFSMVPVTPSYERIGLFDAAGALYPSEYSTWYGFYTSPSGITAVRCGDAQVSLSQAYVLGTDKLRVELWDDSVRYFLNEVELYRLNTPAVAAAYVAGIIIVQPNKSWRDGLIAGQNLTTR
jgi:hypothetical protein